MKGKGRLLMLREIPRMHLATEKGPGAEEKAGRGVSREGVAYKGK